MPLLKFDLEKSGSGWMPDVWIECMVGNQDRSISNEYKDTEQTIRRYSVKAVERVDNSDSISHTVAGNFFGK